MKIEASLNIAEKRLPQDGRITKKIKGKRVDVRVSTIPTAKGERIVLRLLDKEQILLDLPGLGFSHERLSIMEHLISRPNGIILVTGPTGAGKTTTLYACLNKINKPDVNILTVEDPVEYELRGIPQMHVQPKIGLTFASGLRAFLRQDPDVIMVGEIRDFETAEIAIHASLTGHLVLSTLHTNDAAERGHAPDRDGRAAVPDLDVAARRPGAAPGAQAVHEVPRRRTSRPMKTCARSTSIRTRSVRRGRACSAGQRAMPQRADRAAATATSKR